MSIREQRYAFIGGGNMARSLIGGLIAGGVPPAQICASDPIAQVRDNLAGTLHIRTAATNVDAVRDAEVIVFAVKPQEMRSVALELASALQSKRPLVISVAAGIRADDLSQWLGNIAVVRTMPNRPALHGQGATGMFATHGIDPSQRELAAAVMAAVGVSVWVEQESHLDIVTAVSGSGPAYFFLLMEMLEQVGTELGLPAQTSRDLAIATAWGSAYMAWHDRSTSPAVLREQVTSKGGTTEAALKHLEAQQVRAIFAGAVKAAAARSAEMADVFGSKSSTKT
jgi:pyrroline-5-carboxylate reductase